MPFLLNKRVDQKLTQTNTNQPRVAVLTPSRGLIFANVVQYVEDMRSTYPAIKWFFSIGNPIPDCFNDVTEKALSDPLHFDYFFYIEEDTEPEPKTLDRFLEAMKEYDIAAQDYGFNGGSSTIGKSSFTGKILFTGFGCTFMKRKVLESFQKPIFKADKSFNLSSMSWYTNPDNANTYGMYDIRFGSEARKKGFTIGQITGESNHLQVLEVGKKESNIGFHSIGLKGRVERQLLLPLEDL